MKKVLFLAVFILGFFARSAFCDTETTYVPDEKVSYMRAWVDDLRTLQVSWRGINLLGFWPGIYFPEKKYREKRSEFSKQQFLSDYVLEGDRVWFYASPQDILVNVKKEKDRVEYLWGYNNKETGFRQINRAVITPEKVVSDVTLEFTKEPSEDVVYFPAFFPGFRRGPEQASVSGNTDRIAGQTCQVTTVDGKQYEAVYPTDKEPRHWLWDEPREITVPLSGRKVRFSLSASDPAVSIKFYAEHGLPVRDYLTPALLGRISIPAKQGFHEKYQVTLHLEVAVDAAASEKAGLPEPVPLNDDLEITVGTDKLANVFLSGEKVSVSLRADNYLGGTREVTFRYQLMNYDNEVVWKDEQKVSFGPGGVSEKEIVLPISQNGIYGFSVEAFEGNWPVGQRMARLGIVPQPYRLDPAKGFFGTQTSVGLYGKEVGFDLSGLEDARRIYGLAYKLGIKKIRVQASWYIRWLYAEKEKGKIDFGLDQTPALAKLAAESGLMMYTAGDGIDLMPYAGGVPDWAKGEIFNYGVFGKRPMPKDLADYENYCARFAAYLKNGNIDYIEIENEPYYRFEGRDLEQYLSFRETAARGIRSANPNARIIGTYYEPDIQRLLEDTVAKNRRIYDIMSPHYILGNIRGVAGPNGHIPNPEINLGKLEKLSMVCRKYATTLWNGEDVFCMSYHGAFPDARFNNYEKEHLNSNLRSDIMQMGNGVETVVNSGHAFFGEFNLKVKDNKLANINTGSEFNDARGGAYFSVDGSVKSIAIGMAVLASVLDGSKPLGRLAMATDDVYCYLFERDNRTTAAIWTTGEPIKARINLSNQAKLFNVMGKPLNEDFVVSVEPIYLRGNENVSAAQVRKIIESGAYILPKPITVEESWLKPDGKNVQVLLRNIETGSCLVDETQLQVDGQKSILAKFTLSGSEEKEVFFSLATPLKQDVNAVITIKSGSRETSQKKELVLPTLENCLKNGYLAAKHTDKPPVIDGSLDDAAWKDAIPIVADKPEQVESISEEKPHTWKGPSDLSATGCLLWDQDFLYFGFRVKDDKFVNNTLAKNESTNADCVQMVIDTLMDSQGYLNESDHIIGLGLAKDGEVLFRGSFNNKKVSPNGPIPGASFKVGRWPEGLTYEAKIPIKELWPLRVGVGKVVRFNFLVNDDDGNGRDKWIGLTPGIGYPGKRDPSIYRKLVFLE